ncbi:glycogen/starch/alpha-glucan phosphorylase [candidate division CSSED10-310 bacterium]|uniref:Alpha-1,4 glucan phosphorylase n=1 Tax=candidate division CSSED10-310 bacterium TaxID=2855610 RepID=A0ABV6Z0C3_UNCC1
MGRDKIEKLWSLIENNYLASDKEALQDSFARHLEYTQSKTRYTTEAFDSYKSCAHVVRDRLMERWNDTNQTYFNDNVKRVYYLSLEFLLGRALSNALLNLGILPEMERALADFGLSHTDLSEIEPDAGLGNGGLGRLAACFLDSMATLQLPGEGYGIRYDYGIFEQKIVNGYQTELPENWLRYGYPFEIIRPEYQYTIHFYGNVSQYQDDQGSLRNDWLNTEKVMALAHDIPIPGYQNDTVNTVRLWSAKSTREFELAEFNIGDYVGAVEGKINSEIISSVLYPKDDIPAGKELRLKQEYFFVSATIQDIIRRHKVKNPSVLNMPDKVAIQLNDTHPALSIAELMRIFVDVEKIGWDKAWELCVPIFAYTNHTMMSEALELWPVDLLSNLLPRHLQIIYEINHRFLNNIRQIYPNEEDKHKRMSIVQELPQKAIRMANLAIIGSHKVNGVSHLHTELIKQKLFADFHDLWPEKFTSKTNGITQRRWLKLANPRLAGLISDTVGENWITDLYELEKLEPYAADASFGEAWQKVKLENKKDLALYIKKQNGIEVNPYSMFDIQIKRIHEYKRQLMNVLHILHLYRQIKNNPTTPIVPRTFIFSGKAAPGYYMAKLIIKLINDVALKINNDPETRDKIKVVFLANYCVSLAQQIFPAADLSEQISTAGMEASGTGNMKFTLNGALTIGTLDGANIEIKEEVGDDNIFIFGLDADQVRDLKTSGYNPLGYLNHSPELHDVLRMLVDGEFSAHKEDLYKPIIESLLYQGDNYMVIADYQSYCNCQQKVASLFQNQAMWTQKSIINTAHVGKFSSDRTIQEYADEVWGVKPVKPKIKQGRKSMK